MSERPAMTDKKMTCPAVLLALSASPAPNMREAYDPAPTPIPTPMAAKTICRGNVMVKAAMVRGLNRASQRESMTLYMAMESMASMEGQLIFIRRGRMGPTPRSKTFFFIARGVTWR